MSFGADIRGLYQLRRTARLTNDSPNSLFVEHSHNGRYRRPRPPLILSDYHIYDGVVRLERYSLERTPLFLLCPLVESFLEAQPVYPFARATTVYPCQLYNEFRLLTEFSGKALTSPKVVFVRSRDGIAEFRHLLRGWQIATACRRFDTFLSGAIKATGGGTLPLLPFLPGPPRNSLHAPLVSRRVSIVRPAMQLFLRAFFPPTLGRRVYEGQGGGERRRDTFLRDGARERRNDARGTWNSGSGCLRRPLT